MRTAESKIASLEETIRRLVAARAEGRRVALASGSFEVLHAAQTRWLDTVKASADVLVVAVTSDATLVPEHDRAVLVAAVRAVDHVVVVPAQELEDVARRLGADDHRRADETETQALLARLRS
jgi:bifunctional ADP-heptose synthase (sugar kinase/adenylyltransferase)